MAEADNMGGFLPPALPSPPASSVAGSSASRGALPQSRSHALRPGSAKETAFIHHVDQSINRINRRFAKRHIQGEDGDAADGSQERVRGYKSFREAGRDMERLLGLVWVSGTPSLQVPYLLSLALMTLNMMPAFPPSPRVLFTLLKKLDTAFSSLIQGRDVESGERLPGFEGGRPVSATEKVRIKGLVEATRVAVVELMNGNDFDPDGDAERGDDLGVDQVDGSVHVDEEDDDDEVDMNMARVYDQTLLELGDWLGGQSNG